MFCFKLFKTTFQKEKDNAMIKINYNITIQDHAWWVNRQNVAPIILQTKYYIWILNPWTMDDNTLTSEVYTSTNNMEDEEDYIFDDEVNDSQQWGDNLLHIINEYCKKSELCISWKWLWSYFSLLKCRNVKESCCHKIRDQRRIWVGEELQWTCFTTP